MQEFTIEGVIGQGWQIFKKKWATIYGLFLISMLPQIISSVLGNVFGDSILVLVFSFIFIIVNAIITMGLIKSFIYLVRGQEVSFDLIISTSKDLWKYILGGLRYSLLVMVGYILFVIPGIIWGIKYMFTPALIIDKSMNGKEAMDASAKMTDGLKWKLFFTFFVIGLFALAGMLALFVGMFVTIPVAVLTYYVIYNILLARIERLTVSQAQPQQPLQATSTVNNPINMQNNMPTGVLPIQQ